METPRKRHLQLLQGLGGVFLWVLNATRSSKFNSKKVEFRWDLKDKLFTMGVVGHRMG